VNLPAIIPLGFIYDGVPLHFLPAVGKFSKNIFPEHWIGGGGPVAWPALSSDLNSLNLCLWRHLHPLFVLHNLQTSRVWNNEYGMLLKWILRNVEFSSQACSFLLDVQRSAFQFQLDIWSIYIILQEAVSPKPCFRKHPFIKSLLLAKYSRFISVRLSVDFSFTLYTMNVLSHRLQF
jgi:hypothetical protein